MTTKKIMTVDGLTSDAIIGLTKKEWIGWKDGIKISRCTRCHRAITPKEYAAEKAAPGSKIRKFGDHYFTVECRNRIDEMVTMFPDTTEEVIAKYLNVMHRRNMACTTPVGQVLNDTGSIKGIVTAMARWNISRAEVEAYADKRHQGDKIRKAMKWVK